MVASSNAIKSRGRNKTRVIPITSLPDELLLTKIVARIAASSFTDLFNLKLVSKSLLNFSNDPYVLQRVSVDKFPIVPWQKNPNMSGFLKKCRANENAESLYRKGIVNYFNYKSHNTQKGLKHIAKAAQKGHREAIYLHGIISICLGHKLEQTCRETLSFLLKSSMSRTLENLDECRQKIRDHIRSMWTNKSVADHLQISYHRKECECDDQTMVILNRNNVWNRYGVGEEENCNVCKSCFWHQEVNLFLEILKNSCLC